MKAIRIHQYGPPAALVLDEVPDPEAGPGDVVVAVEAAGVNPADYKFRNGMLAAVIGKPLPFTPGMDVAGTVIAVGAGAKGFAPGDRVLAMLYMMGNGGYAEKVAIPADWCAHLPDGLDAVAAATLPTPATTAVELIEDELNVQVGQRLLVIGAAGAVGLVACFVGKRRGAHVTAAVRRDQAAAVRHADEILLLDGDEPLPTARFDRVADSIGGEVAKRLLVTVKPGGLVASVSTARFANDAGLDLQIRNFANRIDAPRLGELAKAAAAGDMALPAIRRMPLASAAAAHELLEAGGCGKIVLTTG